MTNKLCVPALAGSNKTFTLAKAVATQDYAGSPLASNRILYLAPSIALGLEFSSLAKALNEHIKVSVINSDDKNSPAVYVALHEALTRQSDEPELVIATHRAYERLEPFDASEWVVVMDEAPAMFTTTNIKFSSSVHISDYTELFDYDIKSRKLSVNKKTARVADLSGISTELSNLIAQLKTGKYQAFARILPEEQTKVANKHTLSVFVTPSENYAVGKQFILMGADCDMHPVAQSFDKIDIGSGNKNHLSERININFVTEKTNNSQYLRNSKPELYTQILTECVEHAKTVKNEYNILLTSNKEEKTPYIPSAAYITLLEWLTIGLNKYRMSNTIILAATQNISSDDATFLKDYCGYTQEQIEWERMFSPNYQRVMRTCIRQQEELNEDVHIYVFSRQEAVRMKKYFPNAKLNKIGSVAESERKAWNVGITSSGLNTKQRETLKTFRKRYNPEKYTKTQQMKIALALEKKGRDAYDALLQLKLIKD